MLVRMPSSKPELPPLSPKTCGECASPIPPNHPGGLCAKCLLKAGLPDSFLGASILNAGATSLVPPPEFPFLLGNYRILSLLGRGGMGAVYEAEHLETGRRLALKILSHTLDLPEARKRFLREGLLAASINHPNCVYIFGTEEIEGHPVIAMELVPGGTTLRDRIRSKPLPPKEAVDAILQVIAGLEAAQSRDVLHRDIKPTNCFVSPDGTVKVGDFGLSISTLVTEETHLTVSGLLLGTPAYASPEQIRGDALDLRSDLYSVGATLFSLLTGRPPFEGDRAVQVIAAVLEKPARNPAEIAPKIPSGLADIVLRCLSKLPDERFKNYRELREALLPFSSSVPETAPISLRLAAGLVDSLLGFMAASILAMATMSFSGLLTDSPAWRIPLTLAPYAAHLLYYSLCEGLWGASIGKHLLGLCVVSRQGGPPGLWRASKRCLLFLAPSWAYTILISLFSPKLTSHPDSAWILALLVWVAALLAKSLPFLPLLRRNNRTGFHDLWSRTRVILRPSLTHRALSDSPPHPITPIGEDAQKLGPFRLLQPLSSHWSLAFDDSLQRHVWIHSVPTDSPALPPSRTSLSRKTRLRWIAGVRSPRHAWDAFDAPEGVSLLGLPKQPWKTVRAWLADLVEEFARASKDNSLPKTASLSQIWITPEGHALLLDEPAPSSSPHSPEAEAAFPLDGLMPFQAFLAHLTDFCLDPEHLPLHAHDFLRHLRAASFERIDFLQGQIVTLLKKRTHISSLLKAALLACAPLLACIPLLLGSALVLEEALILKHRWATQPHLRLFEASTALAGFQQPDWALQVFFFHYDPKPDQNPRAIALQFLTAKFGPSILSPESDHQPPLNRWTPPQREALRKAIREHPTVSTTELAEAERAIERLVEGRVASFRKSLGLNEASSKPSPRWEIARVTSTRLLTLCRMAASAVLVALSLLQFVSLLTIRNTLGSRLLGLCILGPDGQRATRPRLLLRWLIAWGSLALPLFVLARPTSPLGQGILATAWLLFLGSVTAFILRSKPNLHETLSKTRLVRR